MHLKNRLPNKNDCEKFNKYNHFCFILLNYLCSSKMKNYLCDKDDYITYDDFIIELNLEENAKPIDITITFKAGMFRECYIKQTYASSYIVFALLFNMDCMNKNLILDEAIDRIINDLISCIRQTKSNLVLNEN